MASRFFLSVGPGTFLVRRVRVHRPQIVPLVFQDVLSGQKAHQNAMVLVVVFESAVAADDRQTRELTQVSHYRLQMPLVAAGVDGIAAVNADHVSVRDPGTADQSRGAYLLF